MSHSYASLNEMKDLLELAEVSCTGACMLPCKYLYRNRSPEYFDDILNRGGLMVALLKDDGGDPRSPINGNLSGLFFTANVRRQSNTGKPLPTSPYGPSRLFVPMDYLIDSYNYNIYFADFYCIGTKFHYLILVIAEHESEAYDFCNLHLPCLDWDKNVFLRCDEYDNFEVTSKDHCIIEVMYTHNIDVNDVIAKGGYIKHNTPLSTKGYNLRKNLNCPICNIRFMTRKTTMKRNQFRQSIGQQEKVVFPSKSISIDKPLPQHALIPNINNRSVVNNSMILSLSVHNYPKMNNNLFNTRNFETYLPRTNTKTIQTASIHFSPSTASTNKLSNNVALVRGSIRSSQMSMINKKQNLDVNTRTSFRGVSSVKGISGNQSIINQKQNLDVNARTSFRGVSPAKGITGNQNMIPPSTQKAIKPDNKISFQIGNPSEIIKITDVKNDVDNKMKIVDKKEKKKNKMDDNKKENEKKEKTKKKSTSSKNCCTVQ